MRVAIIQQLLEHKESSPRELADALGANIGNVSYHVRCLLEAQRITLVRSVPVRGAIAHHYRLTSPRAASEALRRLGFTVRDDTAPPPEAPSADAWDVLQRAIAELRQRRQTQGIRRETLARRIGVKPSYLGQVERGEADPRYTLLAQLAEELGTTVGEVLHRAEAGRKLA